MVICLGIFSWTMRYRIVRIFLHYQNIYNAAIFYRYHQCAANRIILARLQSRFYYRTAGSREVDTGIFWPYHFSTLGPTFSLTNIAVSCIHSLGSDMIIIRTITVDRIRYFSPYSHYNITFDTFSLACGTRSRLPSL